MHKSEVISQLRAAKKAHLNWVKKAKMLISGFTIDKDIIPVNATECKFGKWFYTDAQKLNALQNNPPKGMKSIENLHFELHEIYMKIYTIYYELDERSFFEKLFGSRKQPSPANKDLAHIYFNEMEEVSSKLIDEINRMERRILAVSDKAIEMID